MDVIKLPMLQGGDSVEEAIQQMNLCDSRAVIVKVTEGTFQLFTNKEVLGAWLRHVPLLRNLSGGGSLLVSDELRNAEERMRVNYPQANVAVRATLGQYEYGIAPVEQIHGTHEVITQSEMIARTIRTRTKMCVCRTDTNHSRDPAPEPTPTRCPTCDTVWRCA